jgi:hypothetical protein
MFLIITEARRSLLAIQLRIVDKMRPLIISAPGVPLWPYSSHAASTVRRLCFDVGFCDEIGQTI